ncbi:MULTISPECIES: IS3 family transposase [unclassified Enterobacter]|uniref:IS3 family transposase n=1 Tax=unclassified Enterobacter TaxID=2608935 RepID=UPI003856018F
MADYNSERSHESLHNLTPEEYRVMAENKQISKSAWSQNGYAYILTKFHRGTTWL